MHFREQMIISHPEIKVFDRPQIRGGDLNFILMGCDGIW